MLQSSVPPRAPAVALHPDAKWSENGLTVAGGNGNGSGINQLNHPQSLDVDDDQTIYIADTHNHRIVQWKSGATSGQIVAGGNGQGNGANQLNEPHDVIIDKARDSLIICDRNNRRVVRWSRRNGTSGEIILSNIDCHGLAIDENGFLFVVDSENNQVKQYRIGDTKGTVVAGGNGDGNGLNQLIKPTHVFVDRYHSVYVSDWGNDRVMKWEAGAKQGIIVAGGQGSGDALDQVFFPHEVVVDQLDTLYVADTRNDRIVRWLKGDTKGSVIAGGTRGSQSNELSFPRGLSFDRNGNLYVADLWNHRVQKFNIKQTTL
ncbi:unnamed protein product [Rotaria sp. Silwood2]|nr:unnamed protein product [Rotaria sp. Silwood2]CAF2925766.1 unnamed protein product [Rotaria sp. Silwood2]CAF3181449.1 unnamed protein product [Rotaria sp. Silwood2]CAF3303859.1 unnamed protein product [Rotaria sp. Silwood2]CAF4356069.1 unnamed protein product [Rotaria sp. Silwood2]